MEDFNIEENNIEKNRALENDVIRTGMINLNQLIYSEIYDILIKDEEFVEHANRSIFDDLIYYKPVSLEELERIKSTTEEFVDHFGSTIVNKIRYLINDFESRNPIVKRITPEVREVMELVLYRNNLLTSDNPIIKRAKIDEENIKELFINKDKKSLEAEDGILNKIFGGATDFTSLEFKTQEQLGEELTKTSIISFEEDRISKLYLSIGSLTGTLSNKEEKIKIDAPVLFIPVKLKQDEYTEELLISYDDKRHFEINTDIILLNNRLMQENTHIKYDSFNEIKSFAEYSLESIKYELNKFYEDNGIEIVKTTTAGKLVLSMDFAIGLYDVYKNPTQIDLKWILENGFITSNIEKMFSKKEEQTKLNELKGIADEEVERKRRSLIEKNEYEVSFINKLNFPQDKAIKGSKIHDNIVIQGPPGTGKTETITSIISDAVLRGKKILVSSEKLVAIDVIKSRMQDLAKYTILFNKNIESADFYDQINFMISEAIKDKSNQANSSMIASDNEILFNRQESRKEIIGFMKQYQSIFQYLNSNEIGKTYSFLYKNHGAHRTNVPAFKAILNKSSLIEIIRQNRLFTPRLYDILYMLNQKFAHKKEVNEFDLDKAILSKYPFLLTHTRTGLKEKNVIKTLEELELTSNEALYSGKDFTSVAKKILKKVFVDVVHISNYLTSRDEIINVVNAIKNKMDQLKLEVDEENSTDIFNSLGAAWADTFNDIKEIYVARKKVVPRELISNVIFDHTIREILSLKESSNVELQANISNGNISTFNQMISKHLSEIVEKNLTLAGRKLRDKLIDTLVESGKMSEIQSISENQKSFNVNKFMDIFWKEIFEAIDIWLLPTDNVPQFFPLVPEMFDIVIIDEASQMQVEKAIPLLFRAKKLIISGDDKQIKPSVIKERIVYYDDTQIEWDDVLLPPLGLQDALKNKFPNYLLNYHYRSKYSELILFSNRFIYGGNLHVSTPKTYKPELPPIQFVKVKTGKIAAGKNAVEATEVVKRVVKQIKEDPNKTIGIIAFTQKQREQIEEKLFEAAAKNDELDLYIRTNAFSGNGEDTSLFVKNVSEVQGDERDVIFFSITFAKDAKGNLPKHLGVISEENGENRLNVAITRAKEKIVVVSSIEPNDIELPAKDRGGGLVKQYLYYAQAFETKNENNIRRILKMQLVPETKVFESRMHEEIFNMLSNEGYDVEYNYGLDDYKIDFVIRNEDKEIILGINLDNNQYLRNFNTMEREYYLPTYLEARGWNIIRVWSHQWSKDPDGENRQIIERIERAIDAHKNGSVISLFGSGKTILDIKSAADDEFINELEDEEAGPNGIVDEGQRLINERYKLINEMSKQIISERHRLEEEKWMKEYQSFENKGTTLGIDELGLELDEFMKVEDNSKDMDGIEDDEVNALLRLSDNKTKGETKVKESPEDKKEVK